MNRLKKVFALGLVGWPVAGSLSPALHSAALKACGQSGEYRLYPAPPLPAGRAILQTLLDLLRNGELHGLNVTIPHKQTLLPLLDELTPAAQAIGAVNTLWAEDGRLYGDNTDAPGFLADLAGQLKNLPAYPKKALVLGAGGAARAVVYALLHSGWEVRLAARRLEQAQQLAADFPALAGVTELSSIAGDESLIVNASAAGMLPHPDTSPWPAGLILPERAFVYDLVYKPVLTRLMQQASQAGLPNCNGLGMLTHQAALAFQRWSGCPASLEAMRRVMNTEKG